MADSTFYYRAIGDASGLADTLAELVQIVQDRGSQFASDTYRRALREAGLRGLMSSPVNPYDNAQAESFRKTLEVEEGVLRRPRDLRGWSNTVATLHR